MAGRKIERSRAPTAKRRQRVARVTQIELLRAWLDYRKAEKFEVEVGDHELKIEGPVSDRTLEKRINRFKELIPGATYDDVEVILPKGANRRMPPQRPPK